MDPTPVSELLPSHQRQAPLEPDSTSIIANIAAINRTTAPTSNARTAEEEQERAVAQNILDLHRALLTNRFNNRACEQLISEYGNPYMYLEHTLDTTCNCQFDNTHNGQLNALSTHNRSNNNASNCTGCTDRLFSNLHSQLTTLNTNALIATPSVTTSATTSTQFTQSNDQTSAIHEAHTQNSLGTSSYNSRGNYNCNADETTNSQLFHDILYRYTLRANEGDQPLYMDMDHFECCMKHVSIHNFSLHTFSPS